MYSTVYILTSKKKSTSSRELEQLGIQTEHSKMMFDFVESNLPSQTHEMLYSIDSSDMPIAKRLNFSPFNLFALG